MDILMLKLLFRNTLPRYLKYSISYFILKERANTLKCRSLARFILRFVPHLTVDLL